jgi:3',5'-cyclic AMP phosphodiesterase CpdA
MSDQPLRFIHISDSHIGPSLDTIVYGKNTWTCLNSIIAHINSLSCQPDFILHSGDVVNFADPQAFINAGKLLSKLKAPICVVAGNHDEEAGIWNHLPHFPGMDINPETGRLSYAFTKGNFRFVVLDGKGPDEIEAHGRMDDDQLELIEKELKTSDHLICFFMHFVPVPIDCVWIDRELILQNGAQVHKIFASNASKIKGVFLGHIHRSLNMVVDGIHYSSAPSTFCQFNADPDGIKPRFDSANELQYHLVTLDSAHTIVKLCHVS